MIITLNSIESMPSRGVDITSLSSPPLRHQIEISSSQKSFHGNLRKIYLRFQPTQKLSKKGFHVMWLGRRSKAYSDQCNAKIFTVNDFEQLQKIALTIIQEEAVYVQIHSRYKVIWDVRRIDG